MPSGRIKSSDEECGLVSDNLMNESNVSQIQCNSNNGAFLRSLPFTVGHDMSVQLDIDAARCFYPGKPILSVIVLSVAIICSVNMS
jgi:hypothetical protein